MRMVKIMLLSWKEPSSGKQYPVAIMEVWKASWRLQEDSLYETSERRKLHKAEGTSKGWVAAPCPQESRTDMPKKWMPAGAFAFLFFGPPCRWLSDGKLQVADWLSPLCKVKPLSSKQEKGSDGRAAQRAKIASGKNTDRLQGPDRGLTQSGIREGALQLRKIETQETVIAIGMLQSLIEEEEDDIAKDELKTQRKQLRLAYVANVTKNACKASSHSRQPHEQHSPPQSPAEDNDKETCS